MEKTMRGEGQVKVAFCGCGKLHVTYGAVTVHFEREEFLLFAESVGRLGAMVKQAAHGSALAAGLSPNANVCH